LQGTAHRSSTAGRHTRRRPRCRMGRAAAARAMVVAARAMVVAATVVAARAVAAAARVRAAAARARAAAAREARAVVNESAAAMPRHRRPEAAAAAAMVKVAHWAADRTTVAPPLGTYSGHSEGGGGWDAARVQATMLPRKVQGWAKETRRRSLALSERRLPKKLHDL
jgi:hypothetical protein